MSSFQITDEKLAKFMSTFDETVNKIQGSPYLDELFKNLNPVSNKTIVKEEVGYEEPEPEPKEEIYNN